MIISGMQQQNPLPLNEFHGTLIDIDNFHASMPVFRYVIVIAVIDCKTDVDSAFKSNLFVWKLWHRKASF